MTLSSICSKRWIRLLSAAIKCARESPRPLHLRRKPKSTRASISTAETTRLKLKPPASEREPYKIKFKGLRLKLRT
jgi:hypothetical protein